MPAPTQPTVTLSRLSSTSFRATVVGGAYTHRLFYRKVGATLDTMGGTVSGSGTIDATSLEANGQYQAYVIADDGSSYSLPSFASVSLAATDSLTGALVAKFEANAVSVALISGGMWAGEVPEHVEPPYCHVEQSISQTAPVFEDELEFSRTTVQVFALGYDNCHAAVRQLKSTFDYQTLPFSSFGTVGLWPLTWRIYNEHRRWRDNQPIHRGVVVWRVGLHKTR